MTLTNLFGYHDFGLIQNFNLHTATVAILNYHLYLFKSSVSQHLDRDPIFLQNFDGHKIIKNYKTLYIIQFQDRPAAGTGIFFSLILFFFNYNFVDCFICTYFFE